MAKFPVTRSYNGKQFLFATLAAVLVFGLVMGFGTYFLGQLFVPKKKGASVNQPLRESTEE